MRKYFIRKKMLTAKEIQSFFFFFLDLDYKM